MNQELLNALSKITPEEQAILDNKSGIDRSLYYSAKDDEVDAARLLKSGRLIDIRPNVRFVHFPKHTHNYVEFVYMCQGETRHVIDGEEICLETGDLLFMNQHATQEVFPAGKEDIAVNFLILPAFFDRVLPMIDDRESPLRDFLISCLTEKDQGGNYLLFAVHDVLPVQNLVENLIDLMLHDSEDRRQLSQQTMGLLFLNLMNCTDELKTPETSYEQDLMIRLLSYLETSYRSAHLSDFAAANDIDIYTLGRIIKRNTGATFKDLLQKQRLNQACFLLSHTSLSIADISVAVGYENTSFFHRLFVKSFGESPRSWRLKNHTAT
ncbi:MAG: AraC family transcriptional regulator [Bilifractor sp.]